MDLHFDKQDDENRAERDLNRAKIRGKLQTALPLANPPQIARVSQVVEDFQEEARSSVAASMRSLSERLAALELTNKRMINMERTSSSKSASFQLKMNETNSGLRRDIDRLDAQVHQHEVENLSLSLKVDDLEGKLQASVQISAALSFQVDVLGRTVASVQYHITILLSRELLTR
jgi:hypothetical protein